MSSDVNLATVETRLVGCFEAVFPDLDAAAIRNADQATVSAWDSIAALSLINVIEEEFEIELDFEQAAQLTSFRAIADYLEGVLRA